MLIDPKSEVRYICGCGETNDSTFRWLWCDKCFAKLDQPDGYVPSEQELEDYRPLGKFACDCGKMAVWSYAPATTDTTNPFYCDECVPRGCSCNHDYDQEDMPIAETIAWHDKNDRKWKWLEQGKSITTIDDKGREWPCCEYFYDEKGSIACGLYIDDYKSNGVEVKTMPLPSINSQASTSIDCQAQ